MCLTSCQIVWKFTLLSCNRLKQNRLKVYLKTRPVSGMLLDFAAALLVWPLSWTRMTPTHSWWCCASMTSGPQGWQWWIRPDSYNLVSLVVSLRLKQNISYNVDWRELMQHCYLRCPHAMSAFPSLEKGMEECDRREGAEQNRDSWVFPKSCPPRDRMVSISEQKNWQHAGTLDMNKLAFIVFKECRSYSPSRDEASTLPGLGLHDTILAAMFSYFRTLSFVNQREGALTIIVWKQVETGCMSLLM